MASIIGDESWDETQYFSEIELKIETDFEGLIIKLMQRRDELLNELRLMRDEFTQKEKHSYQCLTKMRQSRNEIKALLKKVASESGKQTFIKSLQELDARIQTEEHKLSSKQKELNYLWDTDQFDRNLPNLGRLHKKEPKVSQSGRDYMHIAEPQFKFGRHGKKTGEFSLPRCFSIEEDKRRIIVADGKNSRIQVWSLTGTYLLEFGRKHLKQPWGLCITADSVFVSDFEMNAIFKFNLSDFKLVVRTQSKKGGDAGQYSSPAGIAMVGKHLFVAEYGNNRVSALTHDLRFISVFGKGILEQPICVKSALTLLFVSEMDGTIKTFSEEWKLTKVLKRNHIFSNYVSCFCLDRNLNFLVCDRKRNTILVMSQEGKLILSLNTSNWGCEMPVAVEITRDERIVCTLQEGEYSLVII